LEGYKKTARLAIMEEGGGLVTTCTLGEFIEDNVDWFEGSPNELVSMITALGNGKAWNVGFPTFHTLIKLEGEQGLPPKGGISF